MKPLTPYQKYAAKVGGVLNQNKFAKLQHHMAQFNEPDRYVMLYNFLVLLNKMEKQ